jgi:hypothetical protein
MVLLFWYTSCGKEVKKLMRKKGLLPHYICFSNLAYVPFPLISSILTLFCFVSEVPVGKKLFRKRDIILMEPLEKCNRVI